MYFIQNICNWYLVPQPLSQPNGARRFPENWCPSSISAGTGVFSLLVNTSNVRSDERIEMGRWLHIVGPLTESEIKHFENRKFGSVVNY